MSSYEVHTGRWVNYYLDGAGKSQWTLTTVQGGFLLAAVAAYVTIVGTQFWGIASFVAHQAHATPGPHGGRHHVRQIIYRNASALRAAWIIFTAGIAYSGRRTWYWPKRVNAPCNGGRKSREYLAVLFPLAVWGLFFAAAPLSSLITHQVYDSTEVLLKPRECGYVLWGDPNNDADLLAYQRTMANAAHLGLAYANACYNNTDEVGCHTLPRKKLPYKIIENTTCPFGNRCMVSPLVMDTGWLDSHTHFGINAPAKNRVQIRKQATCAVVNVTDSISYNSDLSRYDFYLGSISISGASPTSRNHTTWVYEREWDDKAGYSIDTLSYHPYDEDHLWYPLQDFIVEDADISLFVISSGALKYLAPIYDPLFKATTPTPEDQYGYMSDTPAGVMTCADRWQIRNPVDNILSSFGSRDLVVAQYREHLGLNVAQTVTCHRLLSHAMKADIESSVKDLGTAALRAQRYVMGSLSTGVPDNQWQWEVIGWFEVGLALLQQGVISFVSKTVDRSGNASVVLNTLYDSSLDQAFADMCYSQKIRNVAQYQNFSIVGVITLFMIGLVIILISLVQDTIVGWFPRMRQRSAQWRIDSVLHLQRLAYENAGQGQWERTSHSVPTVRGELSALGENSENTTYISVRGSHAKDADPSPSPSLPVYVDREI